MATNKRERLAPDVRRGQIIDEALKLAADSHYTLLTRDKVARVVGLTGPGVQYHFVTTEQLQWAVVSAAVKRECLRVVAQAIVNKHPAVDEVDSDLRMRALAAAGGFHSYRLTDKAGRVYTVSAPTLSEAIKAADVEDLSLVVRRPCCD